MHNNNEEGIVARSAGRRLRWLAVAVAAPLFGVVAAFATVHQQPDSVPARVVVEQLALSPTPIGETGLSIYVQEGVARRNETPVDLLERLGINEEDAQAIARSQRAIRPFRLMLPGTPVQIKIDQERKLRSLWYLTERDTVLSLDRIGEGFQTFEQPVDLTRRTEMKAGEIKTSLFASTDAEGIPDSVAIQLADIFGGELDFHRDLRRGDRFAVVYETVNFAGRTVRSSRVLAAEFSSRKQTFCAVWFQDASGRGGYYTPSGENLRKIFLRSPLEFSRVTSGFGLRRHPIFQQWRAHQGVDYGAPAGTKVKATGDGVVGFAGRKSGYGNLIVLRHHGGYSTYYAHLRDFARGLKPGKRVLQGEAIGYVGQTGWATGPHLHYEFRVHEQNRNPLTMVFQSALPLLEIELPAFKRASGPLLARLDLLKNSELAMLE
ncbi:MAG TPA: M23 family metallopeptidase [Burkholderiales bacterium]|nr:M23 family metallopeptidase [Burkholderiales bacterium]